MSLILDALKKAEQDRHAGQAPVLDELLVRRAPPAARRRNQQQDVAVLAAVIFAVLFAVAGVIYWLWPSRTEPAPSAAESTPAVASAAPAAAPTEVAIEPPAALRVDPERLEAPVSDLPEDAVQTGDTGAAQAMTMDELDGDAPQRSPTKPPQNDVAAPSPSQPATAVNSSAIATAPENPPPPVVAATSPPSPAPATEPAVRSLKEMPPSFRSEFPKLTVDVHVYDANPLRRFVLVNGKKYRETDTLLDGPRVVEITPVGVVLEQRGSRVLLELPR